MIYQKHNYKNKDIEYIKNVKIYEYDIKSAGLNIIYNRGLINKAEYEKLLSMEKFQRNYVIGLWLQKNPDYNTIMMDEYVRIRKMLFEANDIQDDEIISIKKDAIFIINKKIKNNIFENYEFIKKNDYDSYLIFDNIEFYWNKKDNRLDVKGINKESKIIQEEYFLKLIKELFYLDYNKMENDIFEKMINFKYSFCNFELDREYYNDIKTGKYILNIGGLLIGNDSVDDNIKEKLFINYNLNFLNNLIRIFVK